MNCEQAANLISARLDGEISPADLAALQAHEATCPNCRATAQILIQQDDALTTAFTHHRQSAQALADRVIAQLPTITAPAAPLPPAPGTRQNAPSSATTSQTFWQNYTRPLLAAAAGFALALILFHPWTKPTSNTIVQIPTTAAQSTPALAHLSLATGAVFICPSNSSDWRPLESGGAVQAGMQVRTGPKVRCEFQLNDGSQVRMNSNTQLTLAAPRHVEVASGQIFSSVRKQPDDQPFIVKAAPAQATLTALGTAFDVSCSTAKATCTVVEGAVRMEAGGRSDTVRGGETLTFAEGAFGDKKQVDNMMRATQWVDEILVLKGRDNPELASRINDIFAQLGQDKMWYMQAQEVRRLGDHCIIPLVRYIQSDRSKATQGDEMKRREAARIVGDVATTWAIPELINLLADHDGDVRYPAAAALQRLTGQTLNRRPEQWRDQSLMTCTPTIDQWHKWWQQNKSHFPGADPDAVEPLNLPIPKDKG